MPTARKLSIETKRKIRLAQLGKKNSMYGRRHASQTIRRLRVIFSGKRNPMYGKHHTQEARRKISLAAQKRRLLKLR